MYNLFLDDIREPVQYYNIDFKVARTYDEATDLVLKYGLPQFVSFDHDLGDTSEQEKTGYTFAKFLIDYMLDNDIYVPFNYHVHSANPVGKKNIESYLENAFSHIAKL